MAKFMILFTRDEQGHQILFKKIMLKRLNDSIHLAGRSFVVDYSNPLYIREDVRVYVLNWSTGKQFFAQGNNPPMSPKELDLILGTKIIREITQAVAEDFKLKLMYFLLGAVIGVLAGCLVVYIVMAEEIQTILQEQATEIITMVIRGFRGWGHG